MSAKVPFAPSFSHLVYMRVFEGCNLHCSHCFIPKNPKKMTPETVAESAESIRRFAKPGQTILIQWHGGEPTMFGAKWLSDAIDLLEASAPEFKFEHGIQTNLWTYSPEWAELYRRKFGSNVGVSWDPKIRQLARNKPETNAAYEAKFWPNMRQLIADGLEPYLVVTATRTFFETFANPMAFFDKLVENGITKAHIERLTETGYARENWATLGVDNAAYSKYMSRFLKAYELWRENLDNGAKLSLSPFDGLLDAVERMNKGSIGYGCWSGSCDTKFHTIDANGYKMGCTALTSEVDNKRATETLRFENGFEAARKERRVINCNGCPFRSVCSSGCLALSMDDGSGECSGGRGLFETTLRLVKRKETMLLSA
jgi:radical SAM protein with 4Fe4S-binding SPASM domain